jgi:predicted DNA-binding transcriptional regulator YafY
VILEVRVAGLEEVKRWVMGFGPEAEVLEPESLREAIARDASRMAGIYGKPAVRRAGASGRGRNTRAG